MVDLPQLVDKWFNRHYCLLFDPWKYIIYTNIKRHKWADPINLGHQIMSIQQPRLLQCRALNTFSV